MRPDSSTASADEALKLARVGSKAPIFQSSVEHQRVADRLERISERPVAYLAAVAGDEIWIIDYFGVLFRTDDLGKNWLKVATPLNSKPAGLLVNSTGTRVMVSDYRGLLHRSTDSGVNWNTLALPQSTKPDKYVDVRRRDLSFNRDLTHGTIIIDCEIHYTSDGGDSWLKIPRSSMDFLENDHKCVKSVYLNGSGEMVFAIDSRDKISEVPVGIKRTIDNGKTWSDVSSNWGQVQGGIDHPKQLSPAWRQNIKGLDDWDVQQLFDQIFDNRSLLVTNDLIESFAKLNIRPRTNFKPEIRKDGERYWAFDENRIAYSDNDGVKWTIVIDRVSHRYQQYSNDGDTFYAFDVNEEMDEWYVSKFGPNQPGLRWESLDRPFSYPEQYVSDPILTPHTPTNTWVSANLKEGSILTSNDNGNTWKSHSDMPVVPMFANLRAWQYEKYNNEETVKLALAWSGEPHQGWSQTEHIFTDIDWGSEISCTNTGCLLLGLSQQSVVSGYLLVPDKDNVVIPEKFSAPFELGGGQSFFRVYPEESLEVIWAYMDYNFAYQSVDSGRSWKKYRLKNMDDYSHRVETSPNRRNTVMFRTGTDLSVVDDEYRSFSFIDYAVLNTDKLKFYKLPHHGSAARHSICWLDDDNALLAVWDKNYHDPEVLESSDGGVSWHVGSMEYYPHSDGCRSFGDTLTIGNRYYRSNL